MKQAPPTLLAGAVLLLCPLVLAAQADPSNLDTLFYTPQERQAMVLARKGQPDAAQPSSLSQYQGIVRRGAGKTTVWINGKSLPEGAPQTPATRELDVLVEGARLRVGQSIDAVSGERGDVVVPGSVTLQKPKSR